MDFKDRQAGEREDEELNPDPFMIEQLNKANLRLKAHEHSLEFLEGAANWIINQTKTTQTPEQRAQLLIKLGSYPRWRLLELDKFSGYYSEVFKYLDSLQYVEPATELPPGLPEPPTTIAVDSLKYFARLLDDKLDSKSRDRIEKAHIDKMRKKYPQFNWMAGRKANHL